MLVKDVMNGGLEAFRESDSVAVVAMRMRDVGGGFVPVCDVQGRPVGTLTDHAIVATVCAEDRLPSRTRVGDVMDRRTVTCYASDDLAVAEERMHETGSARVLVLDEQQRLVGVVTLADVLRSEEEHRAVEAMRDIVEREYRA